jgi:hypothetical protein
VPADGVHTDARRVQMRGLGEVRHSLAIIRRVLRRLILLPCDDRASHKNQTLPRQQIGARFGPFRQQQFDILRAARQPLHIVGHHSGEGVFAHQRVDRQARIE